jgi:alpha-glucosidase
MRIFIARISLLTFVLCANLWMALAKGRTSAASSPAPQSPGKAVVLDSPDGRLAITFQTISDAASNRANPVNPQNQSARAPSQLVYAVSFQGKALLDPSALRLDLQGQHVLGSDVRITNTSASTIEETYRLVTGKVSSVRNHCNALRIELEENAAPQRKLEIEARAYDDAVAFRYVLPEQASLREFRLAKEMTEFRISKDASTYALVLPNYRTMYESEFIHLPVSAFSNQGGVGSIVLIGLPLLMEVPGVAWMAITEANMRDYAAMYLVNPSASWSGHWLESRIAPSVTEPDISVIGAMPHHSPWRVLLVGSEPGRLIESNVIASLNPPSVIQDTSWIHAGRAAWDWWSGSIGVDGKHAFSTENMKYYVDFAAKSGFEYMLVDAGWSAHSDITKMNGTVDIPELVRYAAAKNVKVWIWLYWSAVDRQLNEAFPLYETWGVAGVKIDFMSRDDQGMIGFYYRVAEKAAQHHLLVDFHGATKPTGLERTYPNVLGYEGVLGMEQSKAGSRDNPDSHVTLPFTRMLAGRMDYTPGGFDNVTKAEFEARMQKPMVMGTRAHQLAMYVVYEAPFQMVSDHPGAYEGQPEFEFIKRVPTTWDEIRVLNGRPGEYITMARRRGKEWFVGSMTNWDERNLEIPLSFLGDGKYVADVFRDGPDANLHPKNTVIEQIAVTHGSTIRLHLAAAGGAAVRFHLQ